MNETAAPGLTVLRTRLPYVDRRLLSEAWMSALGLRRDEAPAPIAAAPRADPPSLVRARRAKPEAAESIGRPGAGIGPSGSVSTSAGARLRAADVDAFRTTTRASVSRSFAPHARSYVARRTTLTLGVHGTRVQLVLRREGGTLHVVALCRSDVARTVGLALVRADAFLRGRGDALRATVHVVGERGVSP